MKSIFLKKGVILIMEMIHQAEKFSSFGAFNGFPFLLSEKTEYLSEANSGICTESKKSIVPSGRELETTVNHYWNLGSVELSFAIKTFPSELISLMVAAISSSVPPIIAAIPETLGSIDECMSSPLFLINIKNCLWLSMSFVSWY